MAQGDSARLNPRNLSFSARLGRSSISVRTEISVRSGLADQIHIPGRRDLLVAAHSFADRKFLPEIRYRLSRRFNIPAKKTKFYSTLAFVRCTFVRLDYVSRLCLVKISAIVIQMRRNDYANGARPDGRGVTVTGAVTSRCST